MIPECSQIKHILRLIFFIKFWNHLKISFRCYHFWIMSKCVWFQYILNIFKKFLFHQILNSSHLFELIIQTLFDLKACWIIQKVVDLTTFWIIAKWFWFEFILIYSQIIIDLISFPNMYNFRKMWIYAKMCLILRHLEYCQKLFFSSNFEQNLFELTMSKSVGFDHISNHLYSKCAQLNEILRWFRNFMINNNFWQASKCGQIKLSNEVNVAKYAFHSVIHTRTPRPDYHTWSNCMWKKILFTSRTITSQRPEYHTWLNLIVGEKVILTTWKTLYNHQSHTKHQASKARAWGPGTIGARKKWKIK